MPLADCGADADLADIVPSPPGCQLLLPGRAVILRQEPSASWQVVRAQAAAGRRGIDVSRRKGRQLVRDDLQRFDVVLAMDRDNCKHLRALCPPGLEHKIRLLMEFAPARAEQEIPDPYSGAEGEFDRVLDMIEEAATGLLEDIRHRHLSRP